MLARRLAAVLTSALLPTAASALVCAGGPPAARGLQGATPEARSALVLFAHFRGELPVGTHVPDWATRLFDPDLPGSFHHFYATMSFGRHLVSGVVAPVSYEAPATASAYLTADPRAPGGYGRFVRDIVALADADIDFAQFDADGDGAVDALFVLLNSAPPGFIRGAATGAGNLGFEESLPTADGDPARLIYVQGRLGTIQRARTFAEAVGSMAHEYGHVLGLPDLYDVAYLARPEAPPEDDGAGIGAWGLMGWGASGWNGDDGPVSFSAWSRVQLGWTSSKVSLDRGELRLDPIATGGTAPRVPLSGREYFLLEYRTRDAYYDRNIPAEGVLIWHVDLRTPSAADPTRLVLDLETADGRWEEAGAPLGRTPDPAHGGDNLDFWAHDAAYREAHAGNLGDAGDPFGAAGRTSFTPETNPASTSNDGALSLRIEEIALHDGYATVRVQTAPLVLVLDGLEVVGERGQASLVSGEVARIVFNLSNEGGMPAHGIEVRLRSDDDQVELLESTAAFPDLDPGERSPSLSQYLRFRFRAGFLGVRRSALALDVYANGTLAEAREVLVYGVSPRLPLRRISVQDSVGDGDGRASAGEIARLRLAFEPGPGVRVKVHPIDADVRLVGADDVRFFI